MEMKIEEDKGAFYFNDLSGDLEAMELGDLKKKYWDFFLYACHIKKEGGFPENYFNDIVSNLDSKNEKELSYLLDSFSVEDQIIDWIDEFIDFDEIRSNPLLWELNDLISRVQLNMKEVLDFIETTIELREIIELSSQKNIFITWYDIFKRTLESKVNVSWIVSLKVEGVYVWNEFKYSQEYLFLDDYTNDCIKKIESKIMVINNTFPTLTLKKYKLFLRNISYFLEI